jgi:hypothetical protein
VGGGRWISIKYWMCREVGDLLGGGGEGGCHRQIWARPETKGTSDEQMNSNEEFMLKKRTMMNMNKLMIRFDMVYWTLNLMLITRLSSYTITKIHLYFYTTP